MQKLIVGIQIPDHAQEYITVTNVDFEQNVEYLKKKIAEEIKFHDGNELEIIYDGQALENDLKLQGAVNPNGIIFLFKKTKKYEPYKPSTSSKDPKVIQRMQELFTLIAHIQINVTSRVTILQKILNEYPEFRRNLAAQAIIRDSVLFNTIHQNMDKIAENYPLICEAAPFIVDTIKKELTRSAPASLGHFETSNESPNSSEEENSLGASSSNESGTPSGQNEESRIRAITRQQLQNALALVDVGNNANSINSLSNIAQRNVDSNTAAVPLSSSASGERISAEMFRQHMARAFSLLGSSSSSADSAPPTTTTNTSTTSASEVQPMDTSDTTTTTTAVNDTNSAESDTIPASYRNHEYAEQLRTMAQMGFLNHEENLTFLTLSNGNIGNAINLLMGALN